MTQRAITRRAFLGTVAGAGGTLILAACTSAPSAQAPQTTTGAKPATSGGGEKITLRIHERANNVVEGGPQFELFRTHFETWKSNHPNVDAKVEPLPTGSEYAAKVVSLHMGGGIGDMVYTALGSGSFQNFASIGVLAPIDDYVRNEKFDLSQYLPNMVNALRMGDTGLGSGPLYGLPLLVHARDTVLFYNKAYLARAGLKEPDGDTMSYDDLLNMAKSMTFKAADGRTEVYGLRESNDYQYLEWAGGVRAFGGELISEDGKKAQFNSPQVRQFWNWIYDLHATHGVAPPPSAGTVNEVFLAGNAAMVVSGGYLTYAFSRKPDLDFGSTGMPKGPAGVRGSMTMGDAYTIPNGSKQKDTAWDLVKWMTNKDAGIIQCGIGLCGARPDVIDAPDVKTMTMGKQGLFNKLVAEGLPFRGPANLRQVEINDVSRQVMGPLVNSGTRPDDAFLSAANVAVQAVLDKPRD
jgi:multiple sugar transport system substrate-binding protein